VFAVTPATLLAWHRRLQAARNFLMDLGQCAAPVKFLIRDRAGQFTGSFNAVFEAGGFRIIASPLQAPRANAICERIIGTPAPGTLRPAARVSPDTGQCRPAAFRRLSITAGESGPSRNNLRNPRRPMARTRGKLTSRSFGVQVSASIIATSCLSS
jgi:hypothetical protein